MAAHPTVGHISGLVTIGRQLQARGARVRFAMAWQQAPNVRLPAILSTALSLRGVVEAAGFGFVPLPAGPRMVAYALAIPHAAGAVEMQLAGRMMTSGMDTAVQHLEAELDREGADVVVADFAFFAAALVAERRRLPLVTLFHSGLPFPLEGQHPFTGGAALSRTIDARVRRVRAKLGLPLAPAGLLDRPYSPDLNLLATAPALEGRALDYGPTTCAVGPCVDGRVEAGDFPFERLRPEATKVYLSLGTVFNRHPERFRALLGGLQAPGVQVVVSAGPSYEALQPLAGPEVLLFRTVPQLAVLRAVDFVVSHGGNNTVNETLLAGRPLLVLPIGGEQEANARRVERLGAGLPLERQRLTAEAVRPAFTRLREEPSFRARAQAVAQSCVGLPGAAGAATKILELAGAT